MKTRTRSAVAMFYRTLVKVYKNTNTIRTSTGRSMIGLVFSVRSRKVTFSCHSSRKVAR
jgi:hypothetical protein